MGPLLPLLLVTLKDMIEEAQDEDGLVNGEERSDLAGDAEHQDLQEFQGTGSGKGRKTWLRMVK